MAESKFKFTRTTKRATVPEIYRKAAKILKIAEEKKAGIKNLIYSSGYRDLKPIYALCAESLRHQHIIEELICSSGLNNQQPLIDPHLSQILITELLWGKGYLKPENARPIRTILSLETNLRSALSGMDLVPQESVQVPRYVRVNTLVRSTEDVVNCFIYEGWTRIKLKKNCDYASYLDQVKALNDGQFLVDFHLEFLLVFPANAQFYDHYLIQDGSIFLQDKASCLSAVALTDEFDGTILDACAAPGMKTSLLAALSKDQSPIIAIERDFKRSKVLRQTIDASRASNVTVKCKDFLSLDPAKHEDIKYILLDPSCSGSGIVKRMESSSTKSEAENSKDRLRNLSSLQCKLLEHAAQFPNVKRIVYSTCSINIEENEAVVQKTLSKICNAFQLEKALPFWHRRGVTDLDGNHNIGENCARVDPKEDLTNGFFISLFTRRE